MTLLIVFNDGTQKRIENVNEHSCHGNINCFKYSTGTTAYWAFVPKENIKYFGPEELWVEEEKALRSDINGILDDIILYTSNYDVAENKIDPVWLQGFEYGRKLTCEYVQHMKEKLNE